MVRERPAWWILDADGEPQPCWDTAEAAKWFEEPERRRVAMTRFPGGCYVSTVFLAIDHSFGDGPPVLWETMAFDTPDDDDRQRRYTSRAEAEKGHREVVREVESLLGITPPKFA